MPDLKFSEIVFRDQGEAVPVSITINKRATKIILRVEPSTRELKVTCPSRRNVADALEFIEQRRVWIRERLAECPEPVSFDPGNTVPFRGRHYLIAARQGRENLVRIEQDPARLIVTGRREHVARRLREWMVAKARKTFISEVERFCEEVGVDYRRITVRDMRTRWGSCSSEKSLCFNWRLIMAPPKVLTYVTAHEVAHLKYLDHSPAFWRLVDRINPGNEAAKIWLKANGTALWSYGVVGKVDAEDGSAAA